MASASNSSKQAQKAKKVAQSPTPMVTEEISFAQTVKEGVEKTPMFLFRVPKHYTALTGHDRMVLDLLWKDHHSAGFLTAMNTLAGHLQALRYMKTLPSPAVSSPVKLEPHTLEAYIGKELKISSLEKELSQLKEKLSVIEAEKTMLQQKIDLCTATWQTEMENQWAQTRARIPPQLYPAQQQVYKIVKEKQHQKFVKIVGYLQQIALNKITRPPQLYPAQQLRPAQFP